MIIIDAWISLRRNTMHKNQKKKKTKQGFQRKRKTFKNTKER